jgi:hypothetical protein
MPLPDRIEPGTEKVGRRQSREQVSALLTTREQNVSCVGFGSTQAELNAEVAAFRERIASADCGHYRARDDRPDLGHRHQPLARLIFSREFCDLRVNMGRARS